MIHCSAHLTLVQNQHSTICSVRVFNTQSDKEHGVIMSTYKVISLLCGFQLDNDNNQYTVTECICVTATAEQCLATHPLINSIQILGTCHHAYICY